MGKKKERFIFAFVVNVMNPMAQETLGGESLEQILLKKLERVAQNMRNKGHFVTFLIHDKDFEDDYSELDPDELMCEYLREIEYSILDTPDVVALFSPLNPFLKEKTIIEALEAFYAGLVENSLTTLRKRTGSFWFAGRSNFVGIDGKLIPREERSPLIEDVGAFYMTKPSWIKDKKLRDARSNSGIVFVSELESIQVIDKEILDVARLIHKGLAK